MKQLSSGAKREILVLNMAQALLTISLDRQEEVLDEDVKKREGNKEYKLNKRIDNRLRTTQELIQMNLESIYDEYGMDLAMWVKKKIKLTVLKTLTSVRTSDVNLEYLTLYIMLVNFSERKGHPLHEIFKPFTDHAGYILDTLDLFESTSVSRLEGEMFDLAQVYIKGIKA